MRKSVSVLLCSALLVALASCANAPANWESSGTVVSGPGTSSVGTRLLADTDSAYGSTSQVIRLNPVNSDVCFREGTKKDGPVAVAAKDIAGFYATQSRETHTEQIVIQFTEQGKKAMAEVTERLMKSGERITIWAGDTKIRSASIFAPITGGSAAFTEPDTAQMKKDCVTLSLGRPEEVQSEK